jgi:hypothetical protein
VVVQKKAAKEKSHGFWLAYLPHIFGPSGYHILIRTYLGKAGLHTSPAEQALEERVFQVFVDFQFPFDKLPNVDIMSACDGSLVLCDVKNWANGLAKTALITPGNFVIGCPN